MLIDSQVHVISPDRNRYPTQPSPAESPAWFELYGLSVEELLVEMGKVGIDKVVLVQPYSAYRFDNCYAAESAASAPGRLTFSCIVNVDEDPVQAARYWVLERGARAIRLYLEASDVAWLDGSVSDAVLSELAALGVVAQVLVRAEQLPSVRRAARRHRELPIVVDHCGFPDLSGGQGYPHASSLFALADTANIYLKYSTQVFGLAKKAGAALPRLTQDLVAAFGATRVMWASDLTVQERPYATVLAEAVEACAGLDDTDRSLVLGGSAGPLWWPPG